MHDGRVQRVIGAVGGQRQNPRQGGVGVLQRAERQPRRAVFVIEQPDQLAGPFFGAPPLGEAPGDRVDLCRVVRRRPRRIRIAGAQTQVEHERQAMTFGDLPDFVRTVGIERRERQLRRLAGVHVDGDLAVAVADDQLATRARGWQRDRQGRDHPVGFLGVAVRREETARFIDQQLVELRVEPVGGATQARRRRVEDLRERLRPRGARQSHPLGIDLPAVADRPVQQCFRSLAVRRALRPLDQGSDLRLGNREGEGARALHLQPRHGREQSAVGAKVARAVDGQQQLLERIRGAVLPHLVLPP